MSAILANTNKSWHLYRNTLVPNLQTHKTNTWLTCQLSEHRILKASSLPVLLKSTQKPYLSKSKDTLLENDFGKSESRLLEYNLSKSLKVAGIYCT